MSTRREWLKRVGMGAVGALAVPALAGAEVRQAYAEIRIDPKKHAIADQIRNGILAADEEIRKVVGRTRSGSVLGLRNWRFLGEHHNPWRLHVGSTGYTAEFEVSIVADSRHVREDHTTVESLTQKLMRQLCFAAPLAVRNDPQCDAATRELASGLVGRYRIDTRLIHGLGVSQ